MKGHTVLRAYLYGKGTLGYVGPTNSSHWFNSQMVSEILFRWLYHISLWSYSFMWILVITIFMAFWIEVAYCEMHVGNKKKHDVSKLLYNVKWQQNIAENRNRNGAKQVIEINVYQHDQGQVKTARTKPNDHHNGHLVLFLLFLLVLGTHWFQSLVLPRFCFGSLQYCVVILHCTVAYSRHVFVIIKLFFLLTSPHQVGLPCLFHSLVYSRYRASVLDVFCGLVYWIHHLISIMI